MTNKHPMVISEDFLLNERIRLVLENLREQEDPRASELTDILGKRLEGKPYNDFSVGMERVNGTYRAIFNYAETNHPDIYGRIQTALPQYTSNNAQSKGYFPSILSRAMNRINQKLKR